MTDAEAIQETYGQVLAVRHHLLKLARRADEWGMTDTHKRLMLMLTQADEVAGDFTAKRSQVEGSGEVIPLRQRNAYEEARKRWAR